MDIVSAKKANAIAVNVTSTASINGHTKKVRDYYILNTVVLVIILLLIIIIICYYYTKKLQSKMINDWLMNFKKFVLKIALVIISMT